MRGPSVPFASRFFNDSFFSRCSRAGALRMRALAKSGFNGDETAGTCCSSSNPKGRLGATEEGVELRGRGEADIFSIFWIIVSFVLQKSRSLRRVP